MHEIWQQKEVGEKRMLEQTVKNEVKVDGINVYNGKRNSVIFHPQEAQRGIIFALGKEKIRADINNAANKKRTIVVSNGKIEIFLVEHLLSAVYALGIDNLVIELSDKICPTLPFCASGYIKALEEGIIPQDTQRTYWKYSKEAQITVSTKDSNKPDSMTVSSQKGFSIDYHAYYPHLVLGHQNFRLSVSIENYKEQIMNARAPTLFPVFMRNEFIYSLFLAFGKRGFHGINEQNYLLIASQNSDRYFNGKEFGVLYEGNEFVRHKILDVMGTLALTGRQFKDTCFKFNMTGHKFDIYALRCLFNAGAFEKSE